MVALHINIKSTKKGTSLWLIIFMQKGYNEITDGIKQALYEWIIKHPQVVNPPTENYWVKVSVYFQTDKSIIP